MCKFLTITVFNNWLSKFMKLTQSALMSCIKWPNTPIFCQAPFFFQTIFLFSHDDFTLSVHTTPPFP